MSYSFYQNLSWWRKYICTLHWVVFALFLKWGISYKLFLDWQSTGWLSLTFYRLFPVVVLFFIGASILVQVVEESGQFRLLKSWNSLSIVPVYGLLAFLREFLKSCSTRICEINSTEKSYIFIYPLSGKGRSVT